LTQADRRPTPLDPYPQPKLEAQSGDEKAYPPELGTDAVAILEGRTFMFSDSRGDVPAGSIGGLLHDDTRFLSSWLLTLNDQPLSVLKSGVVDYYSASFFLTNPDMGELRANSLVVRRLRFVGGGLHEQIIIANATTRTISVDLRLEVGTDYADLFEVKSSVRDRSARIATEHDASIPILRFRYENGGFAAATNVQVMMSKYLRHDPSKMKGASVGGGLSIEILGDAPPPRIENNDLVWQIELPPRQAWGTLLRVSVGRDGRILEPVHEDFGEQRERAEGALTSWLEAVPSFESDSAKLRGAFVKSTLDLAALRVVGEVQGQPFVMPAAGLPWFMTLFGRDTLITALQTLWVGPELSRGALWLFSLLQGTKEDAFRDEEPGRILHEIRQGELTVLGEKPHSPYYGTADATPFYLILLSDYWRYTGDDDFVRSLWDSVVAALGWIDTFGDRDGDGYVEYQTRSQEGLGNQCWKDSWDGVQFSDGRLPYLPIATAEIQGYVYDAKLRVAELAERLFDDATRAAELKRQAQELHDRFNRDFWSESRGGYYVIGLDGDKHQIDSMTSNMGHLLWSGIVPEERAQIIAGHLMSEDMFSGWGVRTLSRAEAGYNPIGYHTGTIWPHDNSIVALGLARYGFRDEANRIVRALLDAASFSDYRLPEAFAGFDRSLGRFPVPYPTACSPQAWATGAPFVFVKVLLGLEAANGEVTLQPDVPEEVGRVFIRGMHAFGTRWDLEAIGRTGHVRLSGD
jgi:glycogen debranching enzyme